ncbi:hypothetical protein GWC77_19630 [Paraburkholderia sp. NMBU_R16]|uniref:hypothetical protein n=1 Tax=Paraburkholderia sp. NMBU_R16 TaxID=2698676 RepID=UPI0015639E12|nr:hypothetical protein [Paraburkholderia sp. NMBU_R16]NRO98142.1 hypothetical protein [Paraburkholderia sp. NMBU_R16]
MSLLFASGAATSLSLLPISLKKKKKENEEGRGICGKAMPRVRAVLPLVVGAAHFLGHESSDAATNE